MGNASETSKNLVFFLVFEVPILIGYCYFLRYQTYVLLFEIILNGIGLVFCVVEIGFCIVAIVKVAQIEDAI